MDTSGSSCHTSPIRPRSPLGKHTRPSRRERQSCLSDCDDTLFTNEYAFLRCGNGSMSESAMEVSMCSQAQSKAWSTNFESQPGRQLNDTTNGSPMKKCRSDSSVTGKSCQKREDGVNHREDFGMIRESNSTPHLAQLTPAQVAGVWKDITLNRLLQLVELETLEGVLAYDAVDGKNIATNVGSFVVSRPRALLRRTTSTKGNTSDTSLSGIDGGCGDGIPVGGAYSSPGVNRRFGSRLSRAQPAILQSQPPAANVHSSLCRSRSARKLQSSSKTPSSLTLHHKLRYSIKHKSESDTDSQLPTTSTAKSIPTSRSCNSLRGAAEGGGRVRGESHTLHISINQLNSCEIVFTWCGVWW